MKEDNANQLNEDNRVLQRILNDDKSAYFSREVYQ